eukprot:1179738-Prorocentrum_minimum.AAC.2
MRAPQPPPRSGAGSCVRTALAKNIPSLILFAGQAVLSTTMQSCSACDHVPTTTRSRSLLHGPAIGSSVGRGALSIIII